MGDTHQQAAYLLVCNDDPPFLSLLLKMTICRLRDNEKRICSWRLPGEFQTGGPFSLEVTESNGIPSGLSHLNDRDNGQTRLVDGGIKEDLPLVENKLDAVIGQSLETVAAGLRETEKAEEIETDTLCDAGAEDRTIFSGLMIEFQDNRPRYPLLNTLFQVRHLQNIPEEP